MKMPVTAACAALLTLSAPAMARTDCHQDMKEMLQGTLEIGRDVDRSPSDDQAPSGCALAAWQGNPGMPLVISSVR